MSPTGKATRIQLFSFSTPAMRAFHMAWVAFFLCFIGWFGIAPLMGVVRKELHLNPSQVGNIIIGSVAGTVVARMLAGWLCDKYGPRITYTWLLILGAFPVCCIGLSHSYMTFLLMRLLISAVGASFVITQYHTSVMFASNCVGTANATTAGWGNMGGGVAQITMPLLFTGLMAMGLSSAASWRTAMLVPGVLMFAWGIAYYFLTQDSPAGNLADLKRAGREAEAKKGGGGSFLDAARDIRVWALAAIYAASFGVELTIHNVAPLYFQDRLGAGLKAAGLIVGGFGMLAIFARTLGGYISDRVNARVGMSGRVTVLAVALLAEGLLLMVFSRINSLPLAVVSLISFGLFTHMSCGATYALIPFVNKRAVGSVAGIVGAGGNVGAVLSGILFGGHVAPTTALFVLGAVVACCSSAALLIRFATDAADEVVAIPGGAVPMPA